MPLLVVFYATVASAGDPAVGHAFFFSTLWIYALWCLSSGSGDAGMTLDAKGQALDLAVIGNCRTAALVDTGGRIVWWCFPRFDSDPVFSRLLAGDEEKGFCDVVLEGQTTSASAVSAQHRDRARRSFEDASGNAVRITDFAPRFMRFERVFNPPQIFRRIEPMRGSAAHHDPAAADLQLRRSRARVAGDRLQPHPLRRRRRRAARSPPMRRSPISRTRRRSR